MSHWWFHFDTIYKFMPKGAHVVLNIGNFTCGSYVAPVNKFNIMFAPPLGVLTEGKSPWVSLGLSCDLQRKSRSSLSMQEGSVFNKQVEIVWGLSCDAISNIDPWKVTLPFRMKVHPLRTLDTSVNERACRYVR